MGYSTDWLGELKLSRPLSAWEQKRWDWVHDTRHEINYDDPKSEFPSIWCGFEVVDGDTFVWDGSEKTYEGYEWIKYFLRELQDWSNAYGLIYAEGTLQWEGEDRDDRGQVTVKYNKKTGKYTVKEQEAESISYSKGESETFAKGGTAPFAKGKHRLASFKGAGGLKKNTYTLYKDDKDGNVFFYLEEQPSGLVMGTAYEFMDIIPVVRAFSGDPSWGSDPKFAYAKGGTIKAISHNFYPDAIKYHGDSERGYSVLIKDKNSDFDTWVDVYINEDIKDVSADWNQYIFHTDDPADVKKSALQDDTNIFDQATSEAIYYLLSKGEIRQNDDSEWFYSDDYEKGYAKGGKVTKYKVLRNYLYGWDNAFFSDDDGEIPTLFDSKKEAEDEINEHIEDIKYAIERGNMDESSLEVREDFKVVPFNYKTYAKGGKLTTLQLDSLWHALRDIEDDIDLYEVAADWGINTNDLSPDDVASELVSKFQAKKSTAAEIQDYFEGYDIPTTFTKDGKIKFFAKGGKIKKANPEDNTALIGGGLMGILLGMFYK